MHLLPGGLPWKRQGVHQGPGGDQAQGHFGHNSLRGVHGHQEDGEDAKIDEVRQMRLHFFKFCLQGLHFIGRIEQGEGKTVRWEDKQDQQRVPE